MQRVKDIKLFEYAIVFNPTMDPQSKKKEQEKPELLVPPTPVLAQNESEAKLLAAKFIPEQYLERLEEVDVLVVPFE